MPPYHQGVEINGIRSDVVIIDLCLSFTHEEAVALLCRTNCPHLRKS